MPKETAAGAQKKRRYRSDGTSIWNRPLVSGPGVWITCVKGKEKQTVGEIYQLFESLASEMWPENTDTSDEEKNADDIEAQVAKELASIKRPRKEQRFSNGQTNTPCVIFIHCKPPVDPVQLVLKQVNDIIETSITQTRFVLRMTPVSASCAANIAEIQWLCRRTFDSFFSSPANVGKKFSYKVELRVRNHTVLSRQTLIDEIARCIPDQHTVDLENPDIFILVEVFKSVCGMSVVKDYYKLKKFNVMELATANADSEDSEAKASKDTAA